MRGLLAALASAAIDPIMLVTDGHTARAKLRQSLAEVPHQWVAQHLLDRAVGLMRHVCLATPRRHTQDSPVGRPVARAVKALRVDEGLQEVNRVRVQAMLVG